MLRIRYALRSLWRSPGFTLTAVLTLALGMGANSAMMSVLDHVVLRALPFPSADRLVRVQQVQDRPTPIAPVRLDDWRRGTTAFESLTGYFVEDASETGGAYATRVRRALVDVDFVQTLGVAPALGRAFDASDHGAGAPPVVLVSDRYWRERLLGVPDVLGKLVRLDDRAYAIAGVMPATFAFPHRDVDLWSPHVSTGPAAGERSLQWFVGVGRLKPGVTHAQARADLAQAQTRLGELHPDPDRTIGTHLEPLDLALVRANRGSLWLLFGSVCVLLLIACTNIASLLLARAAEREGQGAVRHALGATRAHLAAQFLTETAVLVAVSTALALVVAAVVCALVRGYAPDLPRVERIGLDWRTFGYTLATALVATAICGVMPALRGSRIAAKVSSSGRSQVSTAHGLQWGLVGVQVALSVVLLAGAGLLLRSFDRLARVDPGFDSGNVLVLRHSGRWDEEADRARLAQRIDGTLAALATVPGVEATATAWQLPGLPTRYGVEFEPDGGRGERDTPLQAEWRSVSPGYFIVTRIPLVSGAICRNSTGDGTRSELLVNQSFGERYLAGRPVLGLGLAWEGRTLSGRIVGVVGDARESGMDRDPGPTVYACNSAPSPFPWFLVRTREAPEAVIASVRGRLHQLEPLRSVYDIDTLDRRIDGSYAQDRLRAVLIGLFAVTALSLASLGIYGTLGYVVGLRRREIGLRMALGATTSTTAWQVVSKALRVVGIATVAGIVVALACARGLSGMLYGIPPWDPLTFVAVLATMGVVSVIAASRPALRAARIDPMRALREG